MTLKRLELLKEDFDRIAHESLNALCVMKEARGLFFGKRINETAKVEGMLHYRYGLRGDENILYRFLMRGVLLIDDFLRLDDFLSKKEYKQSDIVGTYHSHPLFGAIFSQRDMKTIRKLGDMIHFLYYSKSDYSCVNNLGKSVEVLIL